MNPTILSYASGTSDTPLVGDSIPGHLRKTVSAFGDRTALVDVPTGRRWTYREFDAETDALAAGFLDRGMKKGDRVGIWAQNMAEWVTAQYAAMKLGAIVVNINPAYRSHELEFVLKQSGASFLISQMSASHTDFVSITREVRRALPHLKVIFIDTTDPQLVTQVPSGDDSLSAVLETGHELIASPGAKMPERIRTIVDDLDSDDPINLQYTSGTTGFPKGVTLTHHNILNNGYIIGELLSYTEDDTVVLPVPFFHCFGMVIGTLAVFTHGATSVVPSAGFEPEKALQAVTQEKATSLYGVPTMFIAEFNHPHFSDYDLSTLRTGVMAGSTCPIEVMKRVISDMNMTEVAICYGMTETAPVSTMTRVDDSLQRRTETVGRVMPHTEVKIVDPVTGHTVPRGEKGEVCTRGYCVMRGYWEEPDTTAEAIDDAGWMHTGDLGVMDADGYLDITGRIKDMVIRGGENIYPREIEEFLYQHPKIRDVQVVGVADEKYGEELMAWVILHDGETALSADELRDFCSGKLAHYKIPRYVEVTTEFPMTVSGKIRKVELRQRAQKLVS